MRTRILVAGPRDWKDQDIVGITLDGWEAICGQLTVIEGGAKGVDAFANIWTKFRNHFLETYPADWDRYGPAAGPLRNRQMLLEGKPDVLLAFQPIGWTTPGTTNMIKQAKSAGVPYYIILAEQ